jgi:hypothetical protein
MWYLSVSTTAVLLRIHSSIYYMNIECVLQMANLLWCQVPATSQPCLLVWSTDHIPFTAIRPSHFLRYGPGSCLKPAQIVGIPVHSAAETIQISSCLHLVLWSACNFPGPIPSFPEGFAIVFNLTAMATSVHQLWKPEIQCSTACNICLPADLTAMNCGMLNNIGFWSAHPVCPNRYSLQFLSFKTYFWNWPAFPSSL